VAVLGEKRILACCSTAVSLE